MLKMPLKCLDALFLELSKEHQVYAPMEKAGSVSFFPWKEGDTVCLDTLLTDHSPKSFFFPQSETLYRSRREEGSLSIVPEEAEEISSVYFGVRACDRRSFEILDRVFLSTPCDSCYESKRRNGYVVTLACENPEDTCFCQTFGIDPAWPGGDVSVWIADGDLYWKSLTEKGEALTELVEGLFEAGDREKAEEEKAKIRKKLEALPLKDLSLGRFEHPDSAMDLFESEQWETLSDTCLGCGICTFLCPTCQCYDICDYDTGHEIRKFRCWDSCMYPGFTEMSHGNNRNSQMQRFRQRFMHKLVYFPENNGGVNSCVGCGRCLRKCPSSLNIVRVIKAIGESDAEGGNDE